MEVIKNGKKQIFVKRNMGLFKDKKSMVACTNNHNAYFSRHTDYIWAK